MQQIILFDGVCNLCNAAVNYVIRHDPEKKFRFAPLQSDKAKELLSGEPSLKNDLKSFVLIKEAKIFTRSTAALMVARELKGPVRWLYVFIIIPAFLRDLIYRIVAKNRFRWFGKKESCMVPTPELSERFKL